ncbi:MaoC/PaaZ C-terminal domain-containing protein [Amorphus orientalis]|uniref:Acyl dehydratase n=1 Tax=Amorphus orientalis TaxID=649198 RepID=A0AAE3VM63_9HYPH|nr:MaoC/PaaZ C-terminal domain-containing protein [Amorphus orientalis]MDQ0314493.1 acyl dehydratase [Amorphus orientalis]
MDGAGSIDALSRLKARIGEDLGPSGWVVVTQADVVRFGELTGEDHWIHVDPERARANGWEQTMVQASLMLARLGRWAQELGVWVDEARYPLFYGFDRVRVLKAVPVEARLRCRARISQVDPHPLGIKVASTMGVEDSRASGTVLHAEWIAVFALDP